MELVLLFKQPNVIFIYSSMFYSDPITFYSILSNYRTMEYAQNSTWVLLQPAELLFTTGSSLIFTGDRGNFH